MKKNIQYYYKDIIGLAILTVCLVIFRYVMRIDFANPLAGKLGDHGDGLLSEQMAFLFRKNLSFDIFPILNFNNDWAGFPYGINQSFQSWNLESCWFNYFCWKLSDKTFGWIGVYYHVTVALLTYLLFFIFRNENFSSLKSTIAVIIVVFFNFFAVGTFPEHIFYSVIHWAIIGIALDFFLLKRVINSQQITATFLLIRLIVLILSFGNELGYIASIALLFFIIASLTSIVVAALQVRSKGDKYGKSIIVFLEKTLVSFKQRFTLNVCLSILLLTISYFYLSTFVQLYLAVLSVKSVQDFQPPILNNPFKLLQPYTPFFNPFNQNWSIFRGGTYRTDFAPGLTLVIIGIISVKNLAKKDRVLLFPIALFLLLFFLHNSPPIYFPVLRYIFWLKHIRISSRITLFLGILIALVFLQSNINFKKYKFIPVFLAFFGLVELYTFYSEVTKSPLSVFPKGFFYFMNHVKQQKGEGIFDFPICFIGGNGIGELNSKEKTCRLYNENAYVSGFQIFHEKKVFNYYGGRISEAQFDVYRNRKWHAVSPSEGDPFTNKKLSRCPDSSAMIFLQKFVQLNDFAGINLYPDLLPDGCAETFYKVFGKPTAEVNGLDLGRIQFIPKKKEWLPLTNPTQGKALKYNCNCE